MQKKSVHNVAVVRLRLFSYTKAGGACILYPLRVSTVRKKSLERHCFCILILFLTSSAVVWLLYDFLIPLRQSGFLLQPGEEFKVFHVWLSVHQCVLSSVSCHTWQLSLKQVRKGETDATIQIFPQSHHIAGRLCEGSLSIPLVLPLTSEVTCTEAAPVPLTRPYTPDTGSHLSRPNMESISRLVSPDHFKTITPFHWRSQSRLSPLHY